jgi:hypothetical protein
MAGWKLKKKKGGGGWRRVQIFFFKREGKTPNHLGIQT